MTLVWNVDPVFISIAGLSIHWYGLLFAGAILTGQQLMKWIYQQEGLATEPLDSLLTYVVVGVIVGARLGHCLFYDPAYYLSFPLKILAIWEGGLASHGGFIGLLISIALYVRKYQVNYLWLIDRLVICTALFGIFVRSANFINSEIIGKATHAGWGVIFSRIDNVARHPAQLYEAIAYSFIFVILLSIYRKYKANTPNGQLLALFLILMAIVRFTIEMVKTQQAAYVFDIGLNTGQLLTIPFFFIGIYLLFKCKNSAAISASTN